MHHIPAYETAVTLFSDAGGVWAYPNLQSALKELGSNWIGRHVGPHFRVFCGNARTFDHLRETWVYEPSYTHHSFVMRDDAGEPVTLASFAHLIERRRYVSRRARMLESWSGVGPVPGVHKLAAGRHSYRRPRTMNELRSAALVLKEDGEVAPRAMRNIHHLPRSWDDLYIAARDNRNWKRNRKTRWIDC